MSLVRKQKKKVKNAALCCIFYCRQRPRHSAEDFSLKEAKSQYFQDF